MRCSLCVCVYFLYVQSVFSSLIHLRVECAVFFLCSFAGLVKRP